MGGYSDVIVAYSEVLEGMFTGTKKLIEGLQHRYSSLLDIVAPTKITGDTMWRLPTTLGSSVTKTATPSNGQMPYDKFQKSPELLKLCYALIPGSILGSSICNTEQFKSFCQKNPELYATLVAYVSSRNTTTDGITSYTLHPKNIIQGLYTAYCSMPQLFQVVQK